MSRLPPAVLLLALSACGPERSLSPRARAAEGTAQATVVPVQWYMPATLPIPRGWVDGVANAINTSGVVVGSVRTAAITNAAARWVNGGVSVLGTPRGFTSAEAEGLNDAGVIVGISRNSSLYRATVWTSTSISLLSDNGYGSEAFDVNSAGTVVGNVHTATPGQNWPAKWDSTGALTVLPLPMGYVEGSARAINASGVIVGSVSSATATKAYLWNASGGMFVASAFGNFSRATDINDAGTVLAWGGVDPDYSAGTTTPPYVSLTIRLAGQGDGISSNGRIIGAENVFHPRTWLNTPWTLGFPGGGNVGALHGVNTCGTIVGYVMLSSKAVPAIWTKPSCDP